MEILMSLIVGVLTACGVYLLLRARTFPVVLGLTLLTYAVNLFLFASGRLTAGAPPIIRDQATRYTDPLPQALVLTAIVISFAMTAFVIMLSLRARAELGSDQVDGRADAGGAVVTHLVIAPILLPLLTGTLLVLAGHRLPSWASRGFALAATAGQAALAILLLTRVGAGDILTYNLGGWAAPQGIVLVADRLAVWMLLVTALLAVFALLHAVRGIDQAGRHFHPLFQLQLLGLNGAFLTGDLFNLFVFFEILLLASYGLLLHGGGAARVRAGLHFVVLNLVGSTLFLFAAGALYGVTGHAQHGGPGGEDRRDAARESGAGPRGRAAPARGLRAQGRAHPPASLAAGGLFRDLRAGRGALRHHDQGRRLLPAAGRHPDLRRRGRTARRALCRLAAAPGASPP